ARPGQSVLASILLRPRLPVRRFPLLTFALALAVERALRKLGLDPSIKWPNDILIGGRKICGILTEMLQDAEGRPCAVAGLGLNVRQGRVDFPPGLRSTATSLRLEGVKVSPSRVLNLILAELLRIRTASRGFSRGRWILSRVERRSWSLGKKVRHTSGGRVLEGLTR